MPRRAVDCRRWRTTPVCASMPCRRARGAFGTLLRTERPTIDSNNAELLRRLQGQPDRRAHYTCVLVAVASRGRSGAADRRCAVVRARSSHEPRGEGGFGYDPLFLLPELGRTAAELPPEEKNRISHRGQAMRELARRLRGRGR